MTVPLYTCVANLASRWVCRPHFPSATPFSPTGAHPARAFRAGQPEARSGARAHTVGRARHRSCARGCAATAGLRVADGAAEAPPALRRAPARRSNGEMRRRCSGRCGELRAREAHRTCTQKLCSSRPSPLACTRYSAQPGRGFGTARSGSGCGWTSNWIHIFFYAPHLLLRYKE